MIQKIKRFVVLNFIATLIAFQAVALINYWYFLYKNFSHAAINNTITYQGKVIDGAGIPIEDGDYNMRFRVYAADCMAAPCTDDANYLWEEYWDGTTRSGIQLLANQVAVTNGIFSVELNSLCQSWTGACAQLGGVDFNTNSLYLQVELDTDDNGAYEELFLPRKRFSSLAYAMNADRVDGKDIGTSGSTIPLLDTANTWSALQTIIPVSASETAFIVQGVESQSAHLVEFQTSSGSVVTSIDANGYLRTSNLYTSTITAANPSGSLAGSGPATTDMSIISYWKMDDNAINPIEDDSSLELWFKADEGSGTTLTDSSTNALSGTIVNATWAGTSPFTIGDALTFDGNGDYVEVIDTPALDLTGDYSIGMWIKTSTNFSANAIIAAKYNDGINDGWLIRQNASEQIEFIHRVSGLVATITSSSSYSDGQWHYVMATFEVGVGIKLYVDGFLVGTSTSITTGLANTTLSVRFGAQDYALYPRYWTGSLTNPVIYSRTVSADEILRHYRMTQSMYVADSVGTHHGTITGATFAGSGAFLYEGDNALDFESSSNQYVEIFRNTIAPAVIQTLSDTISFQAWIKPESVTGAAPSYWTQNYTIVELRRNTTTGAHIPFSFGISNGKISLGVSDNYTSSSEKVYGATTLSAGTWYHVGFTISGDEYALYLNGEVDATGTFSVTGDRSIGDGASSFMIGARSTDAGAVDIEYDFDGIIDTPILYNVVRTAGQFAADYASGLESSTGVIIDTASEYIGSESKLLSVRNNGTEKASINKDGVLEAAGVITADITATDQLLIDLASNTQGLIIQGSPSQSVNLLELQSSAGTVLSSFNSSGVLNTENIVTGQITSDADLSASAPTIADSNIVSYHTMDDNGVQPDVEHDVNALLVYQFMEGSGVKLNDTKGLSNATISGASWVGSSYFASGDSLSFTGMNYVQADATDIFDTQSSGSIEMWVKFDTFTTTGHPFSYATTASDTNFIAINSTANGKIWFRHYLANSDTEDNRIESSTTLSAGTYYHIIVTSNGSRYKMYINGVEESLNVLRGLDNGDWFADLITSNTHTLNFGRIARANPINNFEGDLAFVAVYSDELTAQEALRHYKEGQQTYIADSVGGHHGAVMNATFNNSGAFGYAADKSLSFDGSGDYVDLGDIEMGAYTDLSISAWFKTINTISDMRLVSKDRVGVPGNFFLQFSEGATDMWRWQVYDSSANAFSTADWASTSVNDGEWHFFVGVVDNINNEIRMYMDGVEVASAPWNGLTLDDTDNEQFVIGADSNTSSIAEVFNGEIDNVVVYNDVLTSAEIAAQYASAIGSGVANVFDTINEFTASDATLLSLRTAGVEKLAIGLDLITFRGDANKTLRVGRTIAADTPGYDLMVSAGGATIGGTDLAGGDLYLASGISTGTGGSTIYIQTPTPGSTGTIDNTLITQLKIGSDGRVYIGDGVSTTTPRLLVLGIKSDPGDPMGTNGAMYYNENDHKFRCYQNNAWTDCIPISSSNGYTAVTTSTYSIQTSDGIVGVNYAGSVVLTLPVPSLNDTVIIKDESGNASNNTIVILQNASETVDGVTSVSITTDYGSVRLYSDGTNWYTY